MTAIHIKFPALTLKAGKRAFARIREQGLKPADVGILPGAAGGPKALGIQGLYGPETPSVVLYAVLLAMGLMLLWANDFRAVFWVAVIPAALCIVVLVCGVKEPERPVGQPRTNPIRRENLRRLSQNYWWVVTLGAVFTLARFSEAFLVLRLQQDGLPLALTPLALVLMSLVFSLGAYPLGKLSDRMNHTTLLAWGLVVLIAADALLAWRGNGIAAWLGIALWGLHMAMTQGLLATMVAAAFTEKSHGSRRRR